MMLNTFLLVFLFTLYTMYINYFLQLMIYEWLQCSCVRCRNSLNCSIQKIDLWLCTHLALVCFYTQHSSNKTFSLFYTLFCLHFTLLPDCYNLQCCQTCLDLYLLYFLEFQILSRLFKLMPAFPDIYRFTGFILLTIFQHYFQLSILKCLYFCKFCLK